MAGVEVITRHDLAKEWGVTPSLVDNMLHRGALRKIGNGLIDYAHARVVRASQSQAAIEGNQAGVFAREPRKSKSEAVTVPVDQATRETAAHHREADTATNARTLKLVNEARIADLQWKKLSGSLVDRDKVKLEAANVGRLMQGRLKGLAHRLGPMLADISDKGECVKLIDVEVTLLILELQEAISAL